MSGSSRSGRCPIETVYHRGKPLFSFQSPARFRSGLFGFHRFILSSLTSFLLDILLFALFVYLLEERAPQLYIFYATLEHGWFPLCLIS